MQTSDLISVVAAGIAIFSLCVSVWQALQNKPHLRLRASPDMIIIGGAKKEGPFTILSVVNCGAQPTTITNFGFEQFAGPIAYLRRKPIGAFIVTPGGYSTQLPTLLEPGREAKAFAIQDAIELKEGTKVLSIWVGDTWHTKAIRRRLAPKQLKLIVEPRKVSANGQ